MNDPETTDTDFREPGIKCMTAALGRIGGATMERPAGANNRDTLLDVLHDFKAHVQKRQDAIDAYQTAAEEWRAAVANLNSPSFRRELESGFLAALKRAGCFKAKAA